MTADRDVAGMSVLFARPRQGETDGRKEAVAASRDQLAAVLTMLARNADGDVTVIAYSNGYMAGVEALRELRVANEDAVVSRLRIVLAAPDIDVDVSSVKTHDRINHERYATLASLYPRRGAADADGTAVRHPGAFVFNAVGTTISSPSLGGQRHSVAGNARTWQADRAMRQRSPGLEAGRMQCR
jgi:esterase/lipase superfamily enzyme